MNECTAFYKKECWLFYDVMLNYSANIYLFKLNNINNRKRREISSKLTIKHQNDLNEIVLVFSLLNSNPFHTFF